jgi:hypothetical protein
VPEKLETLSPDLDAVFAGRPSSLEPVPLGEWRHEVELKTEESSDLSTTVHCQIQGEGLPETFHTPAPGRSPTLAAMLFEVEARFRPSPSDPCRSWSEAVDLPCRLLTITAETGPLAQIAVASRAVDVAMTTSQIERAGDSARLTRQQLANRGGARIPFPLSGATYVLHWTTVRRRRASNEESNEALSL